MVRGSTASPSLRGLAVNPDDGGRRRFKPAAGPSPRWYRRNRQDRSGWTRACTWSNMTCRAPAEPAMATIAVSFSAMLPGRWLPSWKASLERAGPAERHEDAGPLEHARRLREVLRRLLGQARLAQDGVAVGAQ